jgi:hypothetical protein
MPPQSTIFFASFVDILQILFSSRTFSKIAPLRRFIGYRQMRYREGAKKRSFAKSD